MSNLTSHIALAQDALLAALKARSGGLAGFTIDLGEPTRLEQKHCYIDGDVLDWQQSWDVTGSGAQQRDEVFYLPVVFHVKMASQDFKTVRDVVLAAAAELELELRSNPTLSSTVFQTDLEPVALQEVVAQSADRAVSAVFFVRCEALLA